MIGISLPYKWLKGKDMAVEVPTSELLPKLWDEGVRSIELRAVRIGENPANVLRVANMLWDYGFQITIHGSVVTAENAVTEVLDPLAELMKHLRQRDLVVTLHPIEGDNAEMLLALSDEIIRRGYPMRIALENERRLPGKKPGDSLSLVLDAVTRVDRANVGICFDMGHLAWYWEKQGEPDAMPPSAFLKRVIHTHIHACVGETTHFPLDEWRDPFASYIRKLTYGYQGVYNVELSPERFAGQYLPSEGYLLSARTLRTHYPFLASLYDDIRWNFDRDFHRALDVFRGEDRCAVALAGPTAYLFNTYGFHWAMDLAFRRAASLAQTPARVREYLGDLDLMILTHEHADHMEERTVRALADTEITWLVPDFLVDMLVGFGVRREKILPVHAGETVTFGPLTVRALPGRHFRPDTGKGVRALGFFITADGMPSLAFPGDVRDYALASVEALHADYCFAHVWLSDSADCPDAYLPMCGPFADFMLTVSDRHILLTHLYESTRRENGMWQRHHARAAAAAIYERSPETAAFAPHRGDIIELV